jgi:uncharacterized membrane protein
LSRRERSTFSAVRGYGERNDVAVIARAAKKRNKTMGNFRDWIELAARFIEALAVAIMLGFIVVGTAKWLFFSSGRFEKTYEHYRAGLGKALLVGLELLIAADIIRTVALNATLLNIATLGALVLVRTFLGWTLTLEIEGRWPWKKAAGIRSTLPESKGE